MTDAERSTARQSQRPTSAVGSAGRLAGRACAVEALVLLGVVVFYVVETVQGKTDDTTRAMTSAGLILIGAIGLAVLARGWLTGADWARTPTIVWHLLFVPVAITMATSGQPLWAALLAVMVVVGGGAALVAEGRADHESED